MAEYTAIEDVGDTLVALLRDQMDDLISREREIALASPGDIEQGDDVRLSLYLYRLTENSHLKNAERKVVDPETRRERPLELELYYLLTAHLPRGGNDPTAKTKEQHSVLGRAMQVLHDNPVIQGSNLEGSLAGGQELRVTPTSMSSDEIVNLWNTFQEKPYQPSFSYLVTPVTIESTQETETQRVRERQLEEYSWIHRGATHE